jgi:DNA-binding NarL/FixJ family response regulator
MVPVVSGASPFTRRLLLVEDEPMTTALLTKVLTQEGFVTESVTNVPDARLMVKDFDPDCVLIDISLGPGPTGADLAFMLSQERPDIALLFLTRHPDLRTAGLSERDILPNCGFVRKDLVHDPSYLVEAIEQVLRDQPRDVRHDTDPTRPLGDLTEHQLEILRLLALGYTNDAIARRKDAGRSTVERWIAGILKAMGIDSGGEVNPRVEAVRRYVAVAGIPERP